MTILACLLLLTLVSVPGIAQEMPAPPPEPWIDVPFAVSAAEMLEAANRWPVPPEADVFVLLRETSYDYDAAGRQTWRQRLVYRILTPAGLQAWSTTQTEWAPWYQERPQIRARVIGAGGQEWILDPETLVESPTSDGTPDLYDDRLAVQAPLPGLAVGAVVEEEILVRGTEPFFDAGTAGRHFLVMTVPVRRDDLLLAAPISLPLRYGVRLRPGLEPTRVVEGDRVRLRFESLNIAAAESPEPGLPSRQARYPHVAWSTGHSWQAIARRYSEVVDQQIAGAELSPLLSGLPASGSQIERIAQLLDLVRERVRYTGLELGVASLVPVPPAKAMERGYGDCKDQASLLVALLRGEGIPAYLALLSSGWGKDVDSELPGLGRFNHAIVYVPATPPIWIDPTDPASRAGDLPEADQGRWALIASPTTEDLVRTPAAVSEDNLTLETRIVEMAQHGRGRIVEESEMSGAPERQQRRLNFDTTPEDRREGYVEYIHGTYLSRELGEVEESPVRDLSRPYRLSLEILDAGRSVTDLDDAAVAIRFENMLASLPSVLREEGDPRRGDFVLDQPFVTEWRYRIRPPVGFVPRELPADRERHFGPAVFRQSFREVGSELHADFRFDSGPRLLTAEQFEALRRGVVDFLAEDAMMLWFDHAGAAALAEGRTLEGIDEYRRIVESEPESAIHRVRLAKALLVVGVGAEARRQARRATELDPQSSLAAWSLGLALEYDEIGRRFATGLDVAFDHAAARAALERAVELDPDDRLARAELAILLEYDDEGRRYGDGADLDAAIEHCRIFRDQGATGLDANLLSLLFWAHRFEELEELSGEVNDSQLRRRLRLVAIAAQQGPQAAIRESASLTSSGDEQVELLASAAQYLNLAGRYDAAAVLLRRVARQAANPTLVLAQVEALEKARPLDELEISTADPASFVRSLLVLAGRRDIEGFRELTSDESLTEDDLASITGFSEGQVETVLGMKMPRKVLFELALAALEFQVAGSDELGYRVRPRNELLGQSIGTELFVSPDDEGFRFVATDKDTDDIAREALRRLGEGDVAGARQWLDWARDGTVDFADEDPLPMVPFARLWTRGEEAPPERIETAAAALMTEGLSSGEAIPILERAESGTTDPGERLAVRAALLQAHDDDEAVREIASRILAETDSARAFRYLAMSLGRLEQTDRLRQLARERLGRLPDDPDALWILAMEAADRGDTAEAVKHYEKLRELDALSDEGYNSWAWFLLFEDPVPGDALGLAQRAAALSEYHDRAILHTLATTYAELDRPSEAYQAILQALRLAGDAVGTDDWYVFGRLAEEYGYPAVARADYSQVEKDDHPYATWQLARRRLKRLRATRPFTPGRRASTPPAGR